MFEIWSGTYLDREAMVMSWGHVRSAFILVSITVNCISAVPSQISVRKAAFKDEFVGHAGSAVDSTKWTSEIGGGGWQPRVGILHEFARKRLP